MAFLKDNSLLITSGDGFDYRESAQKLDNHFGKIIRIKDNGNIPSDNPFFIDDKSSTFHSNLCNCQKPKNSKETKANKKNE